MKTIELSLPNSIKDVPGYVQFQSVSTSLSQKSRVLRLKFVNLIRNLSIRTAYQLSTLRSLNFTKTSDYESVRSRRSGFNLSQFAKWIPNKKNSKAILYILIIVVFIVVARNTLNSNGSSSNNDNQRLDIKGPKAQVDINREFAFPLSDSSGEEISEYKYTIENAELRDEILVKGVPAYSIKGRTFLILNVKIVNPYNQAIEVNVSDFVRVTINGNNDELLAPDIHSDPVLVQAISTKTTRVGFPIYDTDSQLYLQVGEIDGDKEYIEIKF